MSSPISMRWTSLASLDVRRLWDEKQQRWYFSVLDLVRRIADYEYPRQYWYRLQRRLRREGAEIDKQLQHRLLPKEGSGMKRLSPVIDAKGLLRICQSIPTPQAEGIKRWLIDVSQRWLEEERNPERILHRVQRVYRRKGYSAGWVMQRVRGMSARREITDEWRKRGVTESDDYRVLTEDLTRGWSELNPAAYKALKGLKNQGLRDHMTQFELLLNALAEETALEMMRYTNAQGFEENRRAAQAGGKVARAARKQLEQVIGHPVVTKKMVLPSRKGLPSS